MKEFQTAILLVLVTLSRLAADEPTYEEPYRPAFHFTPPVNWINDPNGLVHYDGEYHLFYQYNPQGIVWGHMSWGHAISPDLVHWQHLPVAIPEAEGLMAFSGSAVVDKGNTSGFGEDGKPPLVAIYTAHRPADGRQMQHLAFSRDRGRTWTQFRGNPVLDIGSTDFRDPKVFWYAPNKRWVMVIALPTERKISIYTSPDLKEWTHRSDFGPAGAIGGAWECPDLIRLPIENRPEESRWLLQVDLDRRAIAGGSGGQYFVGDFNGEEFVTDRPSKPISVPRGNLLGGFESGTAPWKIKGSAFTNSSTGVVGHVGNGCLQSGANDGDKGQGTATSPDFRIAKNYINFLLGGGRDKQRLAIELLVDGRVVCSETGKNGDILDWVAWDVSEFRGKSASLRVRDESDELWGHIVADHFLLSDQPARSSVERGRWVDYGKDFYALTSWSNTGDRHIWLAWMNNWDYANDIPTHPWRSAMSLPREVSLIVERGAVVLVQKPVKELRELRAGELSFDGRSIEGRTRLDLEGDTFEIDAVFEPGDARHFGLLVGDGEGRTRIGYDTLRSEIYVDRRRSGNVDFHALFAARTTAPLRLDEDGRVRIHLFVDRSSIEVFGNGGVVTLTNRIFPKEANTPVSLFALDGTARLLSLKAWRLKSIWPRDRD